MGGLAELCLARAVTACAACATDAGVRALALVLLLLLVWAPAQPSAFVLEVFAS